MSDTPSDDQQLRDFFSDLKEGARAGAAYRELSATHDSLREGLTALASKWEGLGGDFALAATELRAHLLIA